MVLWTLREDNFRCSSSFRTVCLCADMSFLCVACGECCRHIQSFPPAKSLDRGDGICLHLKNNLCEIYQDRPDYCNSDTVYKKFFHPEYTEKDFADFNHEICKKLIEQSRNLTEEEKSQFLKKLSELQN